MLSWILVYVFLCRHMFPMRGIGGSYGNSIFNILRNCQTFPKQLHHFAAPQAIDEGSSHLWQCFLFSFFFVVVVLFYFLLQPSWEYQTTLPASWEICMQVKKQQLEPDMEEQTDVKLGKEYVKVVYCQSAYLTYMHSTSCKIPGWMKHKLESRLL